VKLLSDYSDVCDHNPPTVQMDRRTYGIAAPRRKHIS